MEQTLLTTVAVLVFLILVSLWLVLYQLVKQQGRMMLRLDHVEQHAFGAGAAVPQRGVQLGPRGIGVGKPFGEFALPDLAGNEVSLESLRGSRVLVVNWSPQCGFCDMVAPDMAKLHGELLANNVRLLLVSAADADANRELSAEHGLECPVLLLKEGERLEAFDGMARQAPTCRGFLSSRISQPSAGRVTAVRFFLRRDLTNLTGVSEAV